MRNHAKAQLYPSFPQLHPTIAEPAKLYHTTPSPYSTGHCHNAAKPNLHKTGLHFSISPPDVTPPLFTPPFHSKWNTLSNIYCRRTTLLRNASALQIFTLPFPYPTSLSHSLTQRHLAIPLPNITLLNLYVEIFCTTPLLYVTSRDTTIPLLNITLLYRSATLLSAA